MLRRPWVTVLISRPRLACSLLPSCSSGGLIILPSLPSRLVLCRCSLCGGRASPAGAAGGRSAACRPRFYDQRLEAARVADREHAEASRSGANGHNRNANLRAAAAGAEGDIQARTRQWGSGCSLQARLENRRVAAKVPAECSQGRDMVSHVLSTAERNLIVPFQSIPRHIHRRPYNVAPTVAQNPPDGLGDAAGVGVEAGGAATA